MSASDGLQAQNPMAALAVDPAPLIDSGKRNWARWLGTLVSFAVLAAALAQWREIDLAILGTLLPTGAAFWLIYVAYYLLGPACEWIIFRRLWRLPPKGIVPLLRKKVSNELVLGYLGEVYFYSWARRHANLVAAPFGAIKDVAVLSAMAGNAVTLLMLVIGAPFLVGIYSDLDIDLSQRTLAFSIAFIAVTSLLVLFLRRRVLSLPRADLAFVMAVHCARILVGIVLLAMMWHFALPMVSLFWWALLSLLRQLVTRLPFVPNKDVIFASLAIFFVGGDNSIPALMTLVAGIVLATHLAVGAVTSLIEIRHNMRRG